MPRLRVKPAVRQLHACGLRRCCCPWRWLHRRVEGVHWAVFFPRCLCCKSFVPHMPCFQPSEYTPFTALLLASLTLRLSGEEALPSGAFNVLPGTGADAGAALSRHRGVAKVTFTGSVSTGAKIMSECAKDIRRISLELGGKSAMIVFDDLSDEELIKAVEW